MCRLLHSLQIGIEGQLPLVGMGLTSFLQFFKKKKLNWRRRFFCSSAASFCTQPLSTRVHLDRNDTIGPGWMHRSG